MEPSIVADEEHFRSLISELVALHGRMVSTLNFQVESLRSGTASIMKPPTLALVPAGSVVAQSSDPTSEDLFVLNERETIQENRLQSRSCEAGCAEVDTEESSPKSRRSREGSQKSRLTHDSIDGSQKTRLTHVSIAEEEAATVVFPEELERVVSSGDSVENDQQSVPMSMGITQSTVTSRDVTFFIRDDWQSITDVEQMSQALGGSGSALQRPTLHSSFSDPKLVLNLARKQVPLHPDHKVRLFWEAVGAILLAYDTTMLPMYSFELGSSSTLKQFELFTVIFWTCDILLSFCTGVSINGEVDMRCSRVVQSYARSWMALDICLVSLEWLLIVLDTLVSDMFSSVGAVRNVRILRFVRLVRLVKLERISNKLALSINSLYVLLSYRIIKMFFALAVASHIIACIWYSVGDDGWVQVHVPDKTDVLHSYFISLHWSIAQFHGSVEIAPRNLKERIFNVLIQLLALFAVSYVTSSLTNSMIMLQNLHRKRIVQQRCLGIFLYQRNISRAFSVQIKQQVATLHKVYREDIVLEQDVVLLGVLPKSLLILVHEAVRAPSIARHSFFRHCSKAYPEFMRQLCHEATQEEKVVTGDVIFRTGQECNRMLFTHSIMSYTPGRPRTHRITFSVSCNSSRADTSTVPHSVEGHTWLSEPVLWTDWKNYGTLVSCEDSYFYAVDAVAFLKAISHHEESLHIEGSLYATIFVKCLNEENKSDLPIYVSASRVWGQVKKEFPTRKPSSRSSASRSFLNMA